MVEFENLVGVEFKGSFQRDPGALRESTWGDDYYNNSNLNIKNIRPYNIERWNKWSEGKYSDDGSVWDRKYDFQMKFLDYDPSKCLFVARGESRWGSSGIVGEIEIIKGEIFFHKTCAGEIPALEDDVTNEIDPIFLSSAPDKPPLRFFEYFGNISESNGIITLGGCYTPVGILTPRFDKFKENRSLDKGFWKLEFSK